MGFQILPLGNSDLLYKRLHQNQTFPKLWLAFLQLEVYTVISIGFLCLDSKFQGDKAWGK